MSQISEPRGASPDLSTGGVEFERRTPWWRSRARLVVVPVDGSADAKLALAAARIVAGIAGASIAAVHVTDEDLSPEELVERANLSRTETQGLVVERASGDPAAAIVEVAERHQAMLIAMSVPRPAGGGLEKVRTLVEAVLETAPCPVLLVRRQSGESESTLHNPRRILLPLDGTPSSAASIGPALELAEKTQAQVDILYVAIQAEQPSERGSLTAPQYVDQPQYEWPSWAREFASRFGTALGQFKPSTPTQVFLRSGDPPREIVHFAREHDTDLIVLEWSGRGAATHGAVVTRVIVEAPVPVLVLPLRHLEPPR
ncbi:MAG: universal stress protein [Chloroflexota bacterium]